MPKNAYVCNVDPSYAGTPTGNNDPSDEDTLDMPSIDWSRPSDAEPEDNVTGDDASDDSLPLDSHITNWFDED